PAENPTFPGPWHQTGPTMAYIHVINKSEISALIHHPRRPLGRYVANVGRQLRRMGGPAESFESFCTRRNNFGTGDIMKIIPSVGSLSAPEDKAVFINAVRKFLTRDLADLPDEAYAWQPVVTAYPIGRSLLHIAAFEHISISAAIGKPIDSE